MADFIQHGAPNPHGAKTTKGSATRRVKPGGGSDVTHNTGSLEIIMI
jgi:hypothetical protein